MISPDSIDWVARAAGFASPTQLFIDGSYVDAEEGRTFPTRTPRNGALLADVAFAATGDVDRAVDSARRAFEDGRWQETTPSHRKAVLRAFSERVRDNAEELALAETLDVGKPIRESLTADVASIAATIEWYAEAIDKLYDEVAPTGPGAIATITREPLGVVGAVVPWNYPLIITGWKIAPALATGNSVVLKPAEQSPLSALVLARLASEAGLPDGVFNVVTGDGPTTGAALGLHPQVDKIAFTGSVETGRLFQRYAGESNGKSVSVELGGKSPQLVLADAPDLDAVAESVAWGVFYNAGQTCHAGTRLVVDEKVHDELLDRIVTKAKGFTVGDPLKWDTVLGAIVDDKQLSRVLDYLRIGQEEGARVATGGRQLFPELADGRSGGYYVEPTVLDGVANGGRVGREEIFGPILSTMVFDGVDEGVRIANDSPFGLAASVWSRDITTAHRVSQRLRAGTVWVNTFDASAVFTPFGGFKASGQGRDRSLHALENYTAVKTTWVDLS